MSGAKSKVLAIGCIVTVERAKCSACGWMRRRVRMWDTSREKAMHVIRRAPSKCKDCGGATWSFMKDEATVLPAGTLVVWDVRAVQN